MACRPVVRVFSALMILFFVATMPVSLLAQSTSSIVINSIDDSAFPQVDVAITVSGALAGTDLSVADFQLFEDGLRVPASAVEVVPGDTQPMNLVLAVDISTEAADLAKIQTGLLALIDRLKSGDQAMLISFADDVRLVQPFTGDLNQVRTAIRQLSAGGSFTALNRATSEALTQAQSLPVGQRAVVIVTDSVENISDTDLAIGSAGIVPVYVVAYSPKVQAPGLMETFARQIGAELTLVDAATAAQVRLQTLSFGSGVRGYRLRFASSLLADGADHTLSINLSQGDAADRDNALFRTQPGSVAIDVPELSNGAQVGGLLSLSPQVSAPGTIEQIEILLDGQPLALLDSVPFAYVWDSGLVTPGSHVLGIRAVDSVGNSGEKYVTVTVVDPIQVSVRTQPERYFLGDSVTVLADVSAVNGVSSVDFLLNDIVVAEVVTPPYQFTLDTGGYSRGTFPVTVRVRDATGFAEATEYPMVLTLPPPRFFFTEQVWLRIFAVVSILLALLLARLLLAYLATLARRQRRARFQIELRNEGNQKGAYLLRADDPKGQVTFSILLNGLILRGRNITDWVSVQSTALETQGKRTQRAEAAPSSARPVSVQPVAGQPAAAFQVQAAPKPASRKGFDQVATTQSSFSISKSASWVTTIARSFMGIFSAVGRMLPASWGGGVLARASSGAGRAYSQSMGVYRINQELEGAKGNIEGGRQLVPAAQTHAPAAVAAASATAQPAVAVPMTAPSQMLAPTQPLPSPVPSPSRNGQSQPMPDGSEQNGRSVNGHHGASLEATDLRYDANGAVYRRVVRHDPNSAWTETPEIAPGDALLLELLLEPKRVGRTRTHSFQIRSLPVAESAGTPLITDGAAKIRGISWFLWLLMPTLVIVITAAIVLFMLLFLLAEFGIQLPTLPIPPIPWLPFDLV